MICRAELVPRLLRNLINATRAGNIQWERSAPLGDRYAALVVTDAEKIEGMILWCEWVRPESPFLAIQPLHYPVFYEVPRAWTTAFHDLLEEVRKRAKPFSYSDKNQLQPCVRRIYSTKTHFRYLRGICRMIENLAQFAAA